MDIRRALSTRQLQNKTEVAGHREPLILPDEQQTLSHQPQKRPARYDDRCGVTTRRDKRHESGKQHEPNPCRDDRDSTQTSRHSPPWTRGPLHLSLPLASTGADRCRCTAADTRNPHPAAGLQAASRGWANDDNCTMAWGPGDLGGIVSPARVPLTAAVLAALSARSAGGSLSTTTTTTRATSPPSVLSNEPNVKSCWASQRDACGGLGTWPEGLSLGRPSGRPGLLRLLHARCGVRRPALRSAGQGLR